MGKKVKKALNVATFGLIVTGTDALIRGGVFWVGIGEVALGFVAAVFLVPVFWPF